MLQVLKLIHFTEVYHFHDMIDMLVGCGYKKGTTLFGYGYDFRQSNRYSFSNFPLYNYPNNTTVLANVNFHGFGLV